VSDAKIRIGAQWRGEHHRSGWTYAIKALRSLDSERGVLFDGIIDKKFAFGADPGDRHGGFTPYREPWIGVLHNPPSVPSWFCKRGAAADILETPEWKESILHCKGLFTLSRYLADWLAPRAPVPVCSLLHPTEQPSAQFRMDAFLENPERLVVHIGWWLRRFQSFYKLPAYQLRKVILCLDYPWVTDVMRKEFQLGGGAVCGDIELRSYLLDHEYDELLARSIVFLDLYDSSANNVIVECIARATPILVNRLPSTEEYLGSAYPFFYRDLAHAAQLARDVERVHLAHTYLLQSPIRDRLSAENFLQAFTDSAIYGSLPECRAMVR
jgi:hypothetical protein